MMQSAQFLEAGDLSYDFVPRLPQDPVEKLTSHMRVTHFE